MSSTRGARRRGWLLVAAALVVVAVTLITVTQVGRQAGTPTSGSPSAPISSGVPSERATTEPSDPGSAEPAKPRTTKPSEPDKSEPPTKERPRETAKAKPGQPPTVGTGDEVPVEAVRTKEPVALDSPATFGGKLSVRVSDIDRVRGRATAPGEIAGAALQVSVEVDNGTAESVDLSRVVLFLTYGEEQTPSAGLIAGTKPLPTAAPAGSVRTGRYIFTVPPDEKRIRVEISYSGNAPTVAFEGRLKS